MSVADKLPIRFETAEEYDDFCSYNNIEREDSKLECLLTYATEAVYVEVVKRNKREYIKRWRDHYVKAVEEEKALKKKAARNRRREAKSEAKQLAFELNQFMQQMKREMEERDGMTEERGKNKRKLRLIGHIDEFLSRNEDPEMLREVSDPALTMWNEPKHPMFTNMARKLADLGPLQPVELVVDETRMLPDGKFELEFKSTRPAPKSRSRCSSRASSNGSAESNHCKPHPGGVSAAHTQSQQGSDCPAETLPCWLLLAAATTQLHPDSAAAVQSQQDTAAAVFSRPGSTTAMRARAGSPARNQQQDRPRCSNPVSATVNATGVVDPLCLAGSATDPASKASTAVELPGHQTGKHADDEVLVQRTAVQKFAAALAYTLFGCFTCEPNPVLYEDESSEEDLAMSSMSFATNQKLMGFISANHQLEYDRFRKRIAHARAKSLSKYQPS